MHDRYYRSLIKKSLKIIMGTTARAGDMGRNKHKQVEDCPALQRF